MSEPAYQREGITIYHGDCLSIMPGLAGQFDCIVTDPPYGIGLKNHAAGRERRDRDWTIAGDENQGIGIAMLEIADAMNACVAAFASPSMPWPGQWRNRLVWHKHGLGMGGDRNVCWKTDWELIQVKNNGPLYGSRESSVLLGFSIRPDEFEFHPCQKPVELIEYLITKLQADTILDPFLGSGTTAVAAIRTGRKCIGIELERKYVDIAIKRCEAEFERTALIDKAPTYEQGELI